MKSSSARSHFFPLICILAITGCGTGDSTAARLPLDRIKLPSGFRITIYSSDLPGARSLALGSNGTLFVSTRDKGVVYAVRDEDRNGEADRKWTIARGLNMPNGVAFRNGDLYIAEVSRIWRLDNIEQRLDNPPDKVLISDALPDVEAHGWKFIAFGPDGKLYVPVGAPCNSCLKNEPIYAAIWRMNPDGSGFERFAGGIRNTVGFDWDPLGRKLWFTDNGRDWLGDDQPSDELNYAPEAGLHFGFPYRHGRDVVDPEFWDLTPPGELTPPVFELGAHVAALGMRFYTGEMFPRKYLSGIFIAEHGSWNRSKKSGYRVVWVKIEGVRATSQEIFAEGWLDDESVWGRPVDVLVMPDGALLVSDDMAGAIYRIVYGE